MTSGMFHEAQRTHAHHHSYGGGGGGGPVPIKNLDRYQRSWKLDVGFHKLQKRINERMRRESTLPPLTLGLPPQRNSYTSYSRKQFYADTRTHRTSQTLLLQSPSGAVTSRRHRRKFAAKSKSENSYNVTSRRYKKSNTGATRVATGQTGSGRRRASSIPDSCRFWQYVLLHVVVLDYNRLQTIIDAYADIEVVLVAVAGGKLQRLRVQSSDSGHRNADYESIRKDSRVGYLRAG